MNRYSARQIRVAPITATAANALVKRVHSSGKVVQNSQLHLGVFLDSRLEGAMQFGPSLDKRKLQGLVAALYAELAARSVEGERWREAA